PVLLKVDDNISTDEILPAGARVLPYRSNIPKISEFLFIQVDDTYASRAKDTEGGHLIVAGENYGQGSSREHAVIAPRYLGLRVVIAKSFARIHWQNLANFGVLALEFSDPADYDKINSGDTLKFEDVRSQLPESNEVSVRNGDTTIKLRHRLSPRQAEMVVKGGRVASVAEKQEAPDKVEDSYA
ncbi:MAG TPA: aconitate hydratase, partial [Arthrobacter sp.]|nr:aconitate hydratase [Arthrobacter sp.]